MPPLSGRSAQAVGLRSTASVSYHLNNMKESGSSGHRHQGGQAGHRHSRPAGADSHSGGRAGGSSEFGL